MVRVKQDNPQFCKMNRGKDPPRSLCEKNFVLEAIRENKRLDGREAYDYRELCITLGKEAGQVEVKLGGTRVLGHVTCQVIQPRPERPTNGQLFFNVELSPMASPAFEVGRPSRYAIEITRIIERCVKESRAVDTESLCIIAGEKVWEIRIDLHVLDHCGNIIDCACIAALTALKHFRRPDVTVIGEEATIHPPNERDPVPLSVHHMPICFTFAFFWEGEYVVLDPTLSEEAVMDGRLVVGMNIHREICALRLSGGVVILPDQVIRCTQIAATKCTEVTAAIKKALGGTQEQKIEFESVLHTKRQKEEVALPEVSLDKDINKEGQMELEDSSKPQVTFLGKGTAQLGMGGVSTWEVLDKQLDESEKEKEMKSRIQSEKKTAASTKSNVDGQKEDRVKSKKQLSNKKGKSRAKSDSEEEDTVVLTKEELSGKKVGGSSIADSVGLSELIALESNKESTEVDESKEQPSTSQLPATTSSAAAKKPKQTKGKTKRGEAMRKSGSPVDVEGKASSPRDGNGESARTRAMRSKGKRRKPSKT